VSALTDALHSLQMDLLRRNEVWERFSQRSPTRTVGPFVVAEHFGYGLLRMVGAQPNQHFTPSASAVVIFVAVASPPQAQRAAPVALEHVAVARNATEAWPQTVVPRWKS
jgi:hypothetical protein